MVPKRQLGEGGDEVSNRELRRRLTSATVVGDVMSGISLHEFMPRLEPFLRRVVQEEVTRGIQRFQASTRSSFNQIEPSVARPYQLQFHNTLPPTLFTNSKVESEDGEPIKIVLVDSKSKEIITCGPLSSVKIEIVVLDGDFIAGERDDWTDKDFNACRIREREGKRPLVTGDLIITLRNGVADVDNICFTDNSSWIRGRKFRLGGRVQTISTGERVREAKSDAFVVKDHRGESYKKHHPPSLADETWRLERIAKDGAFHKRLASAGIFTVGDFLRLYVTDPSLLRNVVLGGGISNKTWDTITEHATTCTLDDRMYLYTRAAERAVLVFNSIWKVIGALFDGQNYLSLDKLDVFQMHLVEDVKREAYNNLDQLVLSNEESFVGPPMLLSSLRADHFSSPSLGLQNLNTPVADQVQLQMQMGADHTTSAPPYIFEVDNGSQLDVSLAHNHHSVQAYSPPLTNSFVMKDFYYGSYREGNYAPPIDSLGPMMMTRNLPADDISQSEMSIWPGNEFFLASSTQSIGILSSNIGFHFSSNGKPRARWCKLRAALKLGISIRRDVAAKRMARLLYYDF